MSDPLADALWEARAQARRLARADWPDVTAERGRAVAGELYRRLRAGGARPVGAKLGATDAAAQQRLGAAGPFAGPLHSDVCLPGGATLSLAELVAPALELEIGVRLGAAGSPVALACVEIVDSRFGWDVTVGHATADFGCQGRIMFGALTVPPDEIVHAVARRDGREVAAGAGTVAGVAPLLDLARTVLDPELADPLVASGSLIAPVPLEPGDWELDFGALGVLALLVRP
jgi:2-keto-4-pentenoate hydratase